MTLDDVRELRDLTKKMREIATHIDGLGKKEVRTSLTTYDDVWNPFHEIIKARTDSSVR